MLSVVRRRLPLGHRTDAVELLDSGRLRADEVEANLADLARLNRLPGGVGASVRAIRRLTDGRNAARILDVGTGAADMPIAFAARGWDVVALEPNPAVLRVARAATASHAAVDVVEGTAGHLPFADGSFDVVHASLLIHHLEPGQAVAALREMRRVARIGVVVNDLRRGLVPLATTALIVAALARSRVTWSDGLASVRRAYTLAELDAMLGEAALRAAWRSPPWMPRVVTVATAT